MKHWYSPLVISMLSLCAEALAQEEIQPQWYEVEVILFEHLNSDALIAEQWPFNPGRPALDDVIKLLNPNHMADTSNELDIEPEINGGEYINPNQADNSVAQQEIGPEFATLTKIDIVNESTTDINESETTINPEAKPEQPYVILPAEQYQMRDQYTKLANSENHQPLLHTAWRQVIPTRNTPDQIHLHSNIETITSLIMEDTQVSEEYSVEMPTFEFSTSLEKLSPTPEEPILNGILNLGLGRYIHVNADFIFKKPGLADVSTPETTNFFDTTHFDNFVLETSNEKTPEEFRIQGNLRLPSGKIHYLDHPMVGMLILFTRYTPMTPGAVQENGGIESTPAPL